jgi:hypothetical protein
MPIYLRAAGLRSIDMTEFFSLDELRNLAASASAVRNHRLAAKCWRLAGDDVKAETSLHLAADDPAERSASDLGYHAGSSGE